MTEPVHEPPTLERLVEKWSNFVSEVEAGYELTTYDYTNDLAVRDLLEELSAESPRDIGALVAPHDRRFRTATKPSTKPPIGAPETGEWWWFRIPLVLEGELRKDLGAEGILND